MEGGMEGAAVPDFSGVYSLVRHENLEEYLKALDIPLPLRKVVKLLHPDKVIHQEGNHMVIQTQSTLKNYIMEFDIGKEFQEDLRVIDGRICQTTVRWEGDRLVCTQRGEKAHRGWTHWLDGDILHLELRAEGVVAKQEFRRKQ